jgi:hypothetical protein
MISDGGNEKRQKEQHTNTISLRYSNLKPTEEPASTYKVSHRCTK